MAKQKTTMRQASGIPALLLNSEIDQSQLLVKLCRNDKQWLSPVGWTDKEKGTLLDCQSKNGQTEVQIPVEFCQQLKKGDRLKLTCDALNFDQEIKWSTSLMPAIEAKGPASEKKRGFFSRFNKDEGLAQDVVAVPTSQNRADEAERAAQDYRAKMEAAELARKDAQRRAEEAARLAEEAAKAEAERIAEMDSAAKAFEEAEKLRLEEKRKHEEEVRAEEERRAEEARLAEEKRLREEAERLEAERKAERDRVFNKIEAATSKKKDLTEKLSNLNASSSGLRESVETEEIRISEARKKVESAEGLADSDRQRFEAGSRDLNGLVDQISNLTLAAEETEKSKSRLAKRLSQAESSYLKAKAEADASLQRAKEKQEAFEAVNVENRELETRAKEIVSKKSGVEKSRAKTSSTVDTLKAQFDKSRSLFTAGTTQLQAHEQTLKARNSELESLQGDIDSLKSSIGKSSEEIASLKKTFADLDGDNSILPADVSADVSKKKKIAASKPESADDRNFFGRRRKPVTGEKPKVVPLKSAGAKLSATSVENSEESSEPIASAGVIKPSLRQRSQTSTMLIAGLGIGGLALMGSAYAWTQMQVVPVQQASKLETVPSDKLVKVAAITDSSELSAAVTLEDKPAQNSLDDTPVLMASLEVPQPSLEVSSSDVSPSEFNEVIAANVETSATILNSEENKTYVRPIDPIDADGLPLEAYKAVLAAGSPFPEAAAPIATQSVPVSVEPAVTARPNTTRVRTARRTTPVAAAPVIEAVTYDPNTTRTVQENLGALGLYSGPTTGEATEATLEAARAFKVMYRLDASEGFSPEFLQTLTQQKREQDNRQMLAAIAQQQETPAVQVADISNEPVVFQNPVQAAPAVAPEPAPTTVAELRPIPTAITPPETNDRIVEVQLRRGPAPSYPDIAIQNDVLVNVVVEIVYDIDEKGRVENATVKSNDYDGRYSSRFERAALTSVKRQRFDAKTINGVPAAERGVVKRVVFRGE